MAKRTTQQTTIWAGVVLALGIGIYYWFRSDDELPSSTQTDPNLPDATITQNFADETAQSLLNAMDTFGTDEESLEEILTQLVSLNTNDLIMIWNSFGTPLYLWGTQGAYIGQPTNLGGWLTAELSGELLDEYRLVFINVASF
jgi:hypothetical protein